METFDAAKREVCVARRQITATPLQALVLLNDEQFLEAARVLAESLLTSHSPDNHAPLAAAAFSRCLGRLPDARESTLLASLLSDQLAHYRSHPADAAKLLKSGARPPAANLDPAVVAAVTTLVSTLFNHDEFVTLR
jgi:hypothetical protein